MRAHMKRGADDAVAVLLCRGLFMVLRDEGVRMALGPVPLCDLNNSSSEDRSVSDRVPLTQIPGCGQTEAFRIKGPLHLYRMSWMTPPSLLTVHWFSYTKE